MNGHEPLIAMRMRGVVPSEWVHVIDTDADTDVLSARTGDEKLSWTTPSNESGEIAPTIQIKHSEMPEKLDFRAVVGLKVMATTQHSHDRAKRLYEALKASQAKRVITFFHAKRGGYSAMFDTQANGIYTELSYG